MFSKVYDVYMKKLVFLSLLLFPLCITSCEGFNAEIYQVNNYEFQFSKESNYLKEVDSAQLISMFEGKLSFPLYFYSENCSTCADVSSYIKSYVKLNKTTIYGYNVVKNMANYEQLINFDSELFPQRIVTPRFLLIKNGTLSLELNSSKFASYQTFENTLKAFLRPANIYTLNTFDTFYRFNENFDNYLCYVYDRRISEQNTLIYQFIYPNIGTKDTTILLLDLCDIDNANLNSINTYLGFEIKNHLMVVNNNEITSIEYSNNLIEFDNLIKSYFGS